MALQSSGQIKISEILTEGGQSATRANTSLKDLEDGTVFTINSASPSKPNGSAPHSMSEWYSYDHSYSAADYYWDFSTTSNEELRWTADTGTLSSDVDPSISVSFWYRTDLVTKDNLLLFDIFPQGATVNSNRFFLNYNASQNRFIARYRSNSQNFDRQWNLHSNSSATGVSNSTTGWCESQRGRVNSDDFSHIVITYDGTQTTGAAAFKCYWNGTELTTTAASANNTRTAFDKTELVWNNDYDSGTGDDSAFDHMKIYQAALTSAQVGKLYNSGTPVDADDSTVTNDLVFEDKADTVTPIDSTGLWTLNNSTGTRTAY